MYRLMSIGRSWSACQGLRAYPGVIITTCTSHLGTVERVTRLLSHSTTFVPIIHGLTERSSEGQPAHTAKRVISPKKEKDLLDGFKTCLLGRGFHIRMLCSPLQLMWDLTIHPPWGPNVSLLSHRPIFDSDTICNSPSPPLADMSILACYVSSSASRFYNAPTR